MITVYHEGHRFHYETERLIRMFLATPTQRAAARPTEPPYIITSIAESGENPLLSVAAFLSDDPVVLSRVLEPGLSAELELCRLLYEVLEGEMGGPLRWGLLTGIRPVKLVRQLGLQGKSVEAIKGHLMTHLLLSEAAADLCIETFGVQREAVPPPSHDEFGLYVSIPFCPTRCSYCSFVSHSIASAGKLIPDYIACLLSELSDMAEVARRFGLTLTSVYIGGGTPTTLEAGQLAAIMAHIAECFDLSNLREYTVEAGRPDTITREKLEVIRHFGGGRISINPQTLSDEALRAIGRDHTAAQFNEVYHLAKGMGFHTINTDLIAGLPTDTPERFAHTVDGILALAPENITIHTLSIKRAATMGENDLSVMSTAAPAVGAMLDYGRRALSDVGFRPYYLYRQQNTLGNYENVGYALPGHEGYYNVVMMEEIGSILSVGAGGVSRLLDDKGAPQRIMALKYPYEYIMRPHKRAECKARIEAHYENRLSGPK